LKRLLAAVERARTNEPVILPEEEPEEDFTMVREEEDMTMGDLPLYETAILPMEISTKELHAHTMDKLRSWLEKIVEVESPVHTEEVARRMIEAAGVARVGSRIRETLKQAIGHAEQAGSIVVKEPFLWDVKMETPLLRNRANLPAASRKLVYIAPEEMTVAIEKVVRDAVAITEEAAIPLVAKTLGFPRMTEELKQELSTAIKVAIEGGVICQDDEWLKVC
jgi:hypothetical protein